MDPMHMNPPLAVAVPVVFNLEKKGKIIKKQNHSPKKYLYLYHIIIFIGYLSLSKYSIIHHE